ncbi:metallophosphoesterase [Candidatus Margulisiibacteriota bacterium]
MLYEGDFRNNKIKSGKHYNKEGKIIFLGEFKDDKYEGFINKQYNNDGKIIYVGKFKNGERDGKGKVYKIPGKLDIWYRVKFENGQEIGKEYEYQFKNGKITYNKESGKTVLTNPPDKCTGICTGFNFGQNTQFLVQPEEGPLRIFNILKDYKLEFVNKKLINLQKGINILFERTLDPFIITEVDKEKDKDKFQTIKKTKKEKNLKDLKIELLTKEDRIQNKFKIFHGEMEELSKMSKAYKEKKDVLSLLIVVNMMADFYLQAFKSFKKMKYYKGMIEILEQAEKLLAMNIEIILQKEKNKGLLKIQIDYIKKLNQYYTQIINGFLNNIVNKHKEIPNAFKDKILNSRIFENKNKLLLVYSQKESELVKKNNKTKDNYEKWLKKEFIKWGGGEINEIPIETGTLNYKNGKIKVKGKGFEQGIIKSGNEVKVTLPSLREISGKTTKDFKWQDKELIFNDGPNVAYKIIVDGKMELKIDIGDDLKKINKLIGEKFGEARKLCNNLIELHKLNDEEKKELYKKDLIDTQLVELVNYKKVISSQLKDMNTKKGRLDKKVNKYLLSTAPRDFGGKYNDFTKFCEEFKKEIEQYNENYSILAEKCIKKGFLTLGISIFIEVFELNKKAVTNIITKSKMQKQAISNALNLLIMPLGTINQIYAQFQGLELSEKSKKSLKVLLNLYRKSLEQYESNKANVLKQIKDKTQFMNEKDYKESIDSYIKLSALVEPTDDMNKNKWGELQKKEYKKWLNPPKPGERKCNNGTITFTKYDEDKDERKIKIVIGDIIYEGITIDLEGEEDNEQFSIKCNNVQYTVFVEEDEIEVEEFNVGKVEKEQKEGKKDNKTIKLDGKKALGNIIRFTKKELLVSYLKNNNITKKEQEGFFEYKHSDNVSIRLYFNQMGDTDKITNIKYQIKNQIIDVSKNTKLGDIGTANAFIALDEIIYKSVIKIKKEKALAVVKEALQGYKTGLFKSPNYYKNLKFSKIIQIPDVHGHLKNLVKDMIEAGLIDKDGNWKGGDKIVVFNGDYIDRGPHKLETYLFCRHLQEGAKKKGNKLILLGGNHELNAIHRQGSLFDDKKIPRYIYKKEMEKDVLAGNLQVCFFDKIKNVFISHAGLRMLLRIYCAYQINRTLFTNKGITEKDIIGFLKQDPEKRKKVKKYKDAKIIAKKLGLEKISEYLNKEFIKSVQNNSFKHPMYWAGKEKTVGKSDVHDGNDGLFWTGGIAYYQKKQKKSKKEQNYDRTKPVQIGSHTRTVKLDKKKKGRVINISNTVFTDIGIMNGNRGFIGVSEYGDVFEFHVEGHKKDEKWKSKKLINAPKPYDYKFEQKTLEDILKEINPKKRSRFKLFPKKQIKVTDIDLNITKEIKHYAMLLINIGKLLTTKLQPLKLKQNIEKNIFNREMYKEIETAIGLVEGFQKNESINHFEEQCTLYLNTQKGNLEHFEKTPKKNKNNIAVLKKFIEKIESDKKIFEKVKKEFEKYKEVWQKKINKFHIKEINAKLSDDKYTDEKNKNKILENKIEGLVKENKVKLKDIMNFYQELQNMGGISNESYIYYLLKIRNYLINRDIKIIGDTKTKDEFLKKVCDSFVEEEIEILKSNDNIVIKQQEQEKIKNEYLKHAKVIGYAFKKDLGTLESWPKNKKENMLQDIISGYRYFLLKKTKLKKRRLSTRPLPMSVTQFNELINNKNSSKIFDKKKFDVYAFDHDNIFYFIKILDVLVNHNQGLKQAKDGDAFKLFNQVLTQVCKLIDYEKVKKEYLKKKAIPLYKQVGEYYYWPVKGKNDELIIKNKDENNIGKYKGAMEDKLPHGKGKLFLGNNLLYEGKFKDGKFHDDNGTEYYPDGKKKYVGNFNNGKKFKNGKFIYKNGVVFSENGVDGDEINDLITVMISTRSTEGSTIGKYSCSENSFSILVNEEEYKVSVDNNRNLSIQKNEGQNDFNLSNSSDEEGEGEDDDIISDDSDTGEKNYLNKGFNIKDPDNKKNIPEKKEEVKDEKEHVDNISDKEEGDISPNDSIFGLIGKDIKQQQQQQQQDEKIKEEQQKQAKIEMDKLYNVAKNMFNQLNESNYEHIKQAFDKFTGPDGFEKYKDMLSDIDHLDYLNNIRNIKSELGKVETKIKEKKEKERREKEKLKRERIEKGKKVQKKKKLEQRKLDKKKLEKKVEEKDEIFKLIDQQLNESEEPLEIINNKLTDLEGKINQLELEKKDQNIEELLTEVDDLIWNYDGDDDIREQKTNKYKELKNKYDNKKKGVDMNMIKDFKNNSDHEKEGENERIDFNKNVEENDDIKSLLNL